jgi:hypothetical protein
MDCPLDGMRGLVFLLVQEQRDQTNGSPIETKCSHTCLINIIGSKIFSIRLTAHILKRYKLYSPKGKVVPVFN